jgi:hypothetical protein
MDGSPIVDGDNAMLQGMKKMTSGPANVISAVPD